jgi:hypothetical protein
MPGAVARTYRSEISLALFINAYVLGHALFQVAQYRYAYMATPSAFILAVCFGATTIQAVCRIRKRVLGEQPKIQ